LEVEIHRKLVLTYEADGPKPQNIEMKISRPSIAGAYIDPSGYNEKYSKYIEQICSTLNEEIVKLIDGAQFHIVEVKITR